MIQRMSDEKDAFQQEVYQKRLNLAQTLSIITGGDLFAEVPFSFLLENIPRLKPRHYSISSSALTANNKIAITAVVDSATCSDEVPFIFKGVCTNYLLALKFLYAQHL